MSMDTLRNGVQLGIMFSGSREVPPHGCISKKMLMLGSRFKSMNIMHELVY